MMSPAVTISLYFILNVLVTITNKFIIHATRTPYLLTASHATASFLSASLIARHHPAVTPRSLQSKTNRINLFLFSALFTINITLSNWTLGLVSLPAHQTIRASAPALTVLISIILQLKSWNSYSLSTYLSLEPIIGGVILATYTEEWNGSRFGLCMTFVGTITAVLKTVATNTLQATLGVRSNELIRITAPMAVLESLTAALYHGERHNLVYYFNYLAAREDSMKSISILIAIVLVNAMLAAGLNLASFEANKKCGSLGMGVAANLKQILLLFVPYGTGVETPTVRIVFGSLLTVIGGMWYTLAQKASKRDLERVPSYKTIDEHEHDDSGIMMGQLETKFA